MKEVIAYIHTHWDREWYQEFNEFRLRLIEVFDEVLSLFENGNLPCFYFDGQTSALEDYLEIRPEKEAVVKSLIKQHKLRIGPFFCSSDSFLVSKECILRNLEMGIKYAKMFGETEFIAYIADSFGHSKDIPILLQEFNLDKACLWRGLGNFSADLLWGNIKVTNLIQGYFQDFLHSSLPIEKKAENLKKYLDKISEKSSDVLLLPVGADHLGAAKNIVETINSLNKIYTDYKIKIGTPFDYFDKIEKREKIEGELLDNSKTFLLKGVYSSRPYIKIANAKTQWLLNRIAQPLNALASKYYNAKNKQSEIDYAYKELIKNHAHDSIYGCCSDEAVQDIMTRYKTVNTVAKGVIKRTIRDLEDENGKLTVINLSKYKFTGKVFIETEKELPPDLHALKISSRKGFTDKKLYNINDIPITEDITDISTYLLIVKDLEPFSLTQITSSNICSENFIKSEKNSIENNFIKLEIQDGIINITDKNTQETYKNFIVIQDRADIGDSYNFGALKNDIGIIAKAVSYKIQSNSNIKSSMNVIYEIKIPLNSKSKGRSKKCYKCKINLEFILYNNSRMLEIKAYWTNKSRNHLLQIGFNLKEPITSTISEDLFATVTRKFDPEYDIYKEIPAPKGIELKTNTAPMQRFVNVQNVTFISKGISEYEINKNTLYLTLLRATGIISNPLNPTRGTPAGPPIKVEGLQCLGENEQHFAFAFTNNENIMYELAEEFYNPCVCFFSNKKNKVFKSHEIKLYTNIFRYANL